MPPPTRQRLYQDRVKASAYFSRQEYETLRAAAREKGLAVTTVIRNLVLKNLNIPRVDPKDR